MDSFQTDLCQALRDHALRLPETSEGTSCVNRAFKVRKKNFLFVGEKGGAIKVMVKLPQSGPALAELGDPRIGVGSIGWVTLRFSADDALELDRLTAWVDESFAALAPKSVVKAWRA